MKFEQPEKPAVVISACLNGFAYRYDGSSVHDQDVEEIKNKFNLITVCPEVAIGLGIPRKTIRLQEKNGRIEAIQRETELLVTDRLKNFARSFITGLDENEIDGFILKAKSPSCGVKSAKVFGGKTGDQILRKEDGIFAAAVREKFPHLPLTDEGRLKNRELKWEFMQRVFLHFEFRRALHDIRSLIDFHSRAKYLFMSICQKDLKILGSILASHQKNRFQETAEAYQQAFRVIMSKPIRKSNLINALNHMFGYAARSLKPKEKNQFLYLLKKYGEGQVDFVTIIELLRSYGLRFELDYLLQQYILMNLD